jgi:hypothetical protein
MTAPVTTRKSTLSEQRAQIIAEKREKRAFIAAINGASWGNGLTAMQVSAFAEFMRRFKLDISEIDNLGGRPYRNGRYYMRRIAELVKAGRVEDHKGEHIGPDARLAALQESDDEELVRYAKAESTRRLKERIRLGVPESATHAYVVRVKVRELESATEGVKWYDPTSTKPDPIGKQFPVETVESRAWRRVGRLVAAEIPELYQEEQMIEIAADSIAAVGAAEAEAADNPLVHVIKPVSTQGREAYDEETPDQPALTEGAARVVVVPPKEASTVHRTPDFTVEDDD